MLKVHLTVHSPEFHFDCVTADDLACMTGEHHQKLERLRRQFDQHPGFAQLLGGEVKLEDPEAEELVRGAQADRL